MSLYDPHPYPVIPGEVSHAYAEKLDSVPHHERCGSWFGAKLTVSPVIETAGARISFEPACTCDRPTRQADLVRRMVEAAIDKVNDLHSGAIMLNYIHGARYTKEESEAGRASVVAAALAVRPEP